jgi:hypothetical protein
MSKTVAYYTIKGLSIPAVIQIFALEKIILSCDEWTKNIIVKIIT